MQLQLKLEYEVVGQMWKVFKVEDKKYSRCITNTTRLYLCLRLVQF